MKQRLPGDSVPHPRKLLKELDPESGRLAPVQDVPHRKSDTQQVPKGLKSKKAFFRGRSHNFYHLTILHGLQSVLQGSVGFANVFFHHLSNVENSKSAPRFGYPDLEIKFEGPKLEPGLQIGDGAKGEQELFGRFQRHQWGLIAIYKL